MTAATRLLSTSSRRGLARAHALQNYGFCARRAFSVSFVRSAGQRQAFDSSLLDTKQRPSNANDTVGPFSLGVPPSSRQGDAPKKWSELSAAGKVGRTTARTSNLAVILVGAGLSAILIYCLSSELFSKNSPTVLHSEACKRIEASAHLAKYLHGPLSFHNNHPSSSLPRHRNHQVASRLFVDANGREHLYLNFHVKGTVPGSVQEKTYWQRALDFTTGLPDRISHASWDGSKKWAEETGTQALEKSKSSFKYLVGSSATPDANAEGVAASKTQEEDSRPKSLWQSASGMFGGLRGPRGASAQEPPLASDGTPFTEGEVHVDLVKNNEGYLVFRYILVDIPDSRVRNPVRVFVERGPGVRESEPVMRFSQS